MEQFSIVCLSREKKFLTRVQVSSPAEVGRQVAVLLTNSVIASISIRRIVPKCPAPAAT